MLRYYRMGLFLITDEDDVDTKADVITDYVKFCTDLRIPVETVKKYASQDSG